MSLPNITECEITMLTDKCLPVRVPACIVLTFMLLLVARGVHGQESRSLNVGNTIYNTNETLSQDGITWPRGQGWMDKRMLQNYGIIIGTALDWTDGDGVPHTAKVAQIQAGKYTNINTVTVPVPGAFKRVFRNSYPVKRLDGWDWTDLQSSQDQSDPNIPADVLIYNHLTTWTGIDIERWAYGFAADEHSDYVLLEYRFTNTSGEHRDGVYIALAAQTSAHAAQPTDIWGDYYGATYRKYVNGDVTADSMRMWYSWDADLTAAPQDTRGKPNATWGHLTEPQYYAYAVVHADASPDDERDDPAQPHKAGWASWDYDINMNEQSQEEIYQILSGGWSEAMLSSYAETVDEDGNDVRLGKYRRLRDGVDLNDFDSAVELAKTGMLIFGPYQMDPGEDVRIVMAFAGGSISPRLAIDAGRAYKNGYSQQQPLVPLAYDVYDTQGNLIAARGSTLSKDQKDAILDLGKEFVFQNAARAIRTWKDGNVRYGQGMFDIPLAPASPSLEGISENDQIRLKWGHEAEQDTRAGRIVNYRIYRNYWRPPSVTSPTDTTFTLIAEVDASEHEYVDREVIRGEDYYYYVTAVTEDGIESSKYLNRTGTTNDPTLEALNATRAPDQDWKENVRVVPNPYHVRAAKKYPDKRLNFLNTPAYCNIHIYTMAGDRIQTLYHESGTGDEDWQRQDTFSTMEIVSGVYFFVVEELDGPGGNPTGETTIGRFVVIK